MSLRVWLPLNGNLKNQGLSDITVTNNGATVNINGKIGSCYYFDGSDDYMNTTYSTAIGTTDFSISMWIKIPTLTGGSYYAICTSKTTAAASSGFGIYWNYSQKKFLWSTADGSGATEIWMATTVDNIVYDKWIHLVMVRNNNDAKKGYFYINNIRYELASIPAIRNITTDTKLFLGRCTGGSYNAKMYLNDFRIYDHALSKKEIEEISKGLILHYKLDNNGLGGENLLSRYVSPGQQAPGIKTTAGRTNYYGDYGIIIPATENADTYFRLFLKEQLIQNEVYTISCNVSGLLNGSFYKFPLFAQNNTNMGVLSLDHNGLCSLTFTMTYSTQTPVTINGETIYVCFMDDSARTIATNQGPITITNFKIEKGSIATSWSPNPVDLGLNTSIIYDSSGYQHNGDLIGAITNSALTPRYNVSTHFIDGSYGRIQERPSICLPTDAITVNLWTRIDTWGNPISCTEGGGWNFENSSGIQFPVYVASVGYKVANSGVTLTTLGNTWHMLTGTFDRENVKIYIDSVLKKTTTTGSTNPIGYANNYLFLAAEASGNNTSPANSAFVGDLSDLRIYCTALTEDQIKELYDTSATIDKNGNVYAREVQEI